LPKKWRKNGHFGIHISKKSFQTIHGFTILFFFFWPRSIGKKKKKIGTTSEKKMKASPHFLTCGLNGEDYRYKTLGIEKSMFGPSCDFCEIFQAFQAKLNPYFL
jgi:hypothetical protein